MKRRDWKRAGQAVARRRRQLGWTSQEEAAAAAGMGVGTWREVEQGVGRARSGTLAVIANALGWPDDMIERVAEGEAPPAHHDASELASLRAKVEALEESIMFLRGRWELMQEMLADWIQRGSQP